MFKTAFEYSRDFSSDGLRAALHQRGLPIDPAPLPAGFKDTKDHHIYLAMKWDREHPDDADQAYDRALAEFGRSAVAAKMHLGRMAATGSGSVWEAQPRYDFNAFLDMTSSSSPLPEDVKREYAAKHEEMARALMRVEALKAELIGVQVRAESINREEFGAWTSENGLQRLHYSG